MSQALSVTGGLNFALAVTADGAAMAWGDNSYSKLGSGSIGDKYSPVPVAGLSLVSNSWLLQDTDEDLLTNAGEYRRDLDPLNPDSNGDELLDSVTGDNPQGGVNLDPDGDGLSSAMEAIRGPTRSNPIRTAMARWTEATASPWIPRRRNAHRTRTITHRRPSLFWSP